MACNTSLVGNRVNVYLRHLRTTGLEKESGDLNDY